MGTHDDKQMAKLILDLKPEDGYTFRWFVRHKVKRLIAYFICFAAIASVPVLFGWWLAVGLLISFGAGVMFCYVYAFWSRHRHWPLDKRILDWDAIKKMSEDEPPA